LTDHEVSWRSVDKIRRVGPSEDAIVVLIGHVQMRRRHAGVQRYAGREKYTQRIGEVRHVHSKPDLTADHIRRGVAGGRENRGQKDGYACQHRGQRDCRPQSALIRNKAEAPLRNNRAQMRLNVLKL
jgi:hypothetical protein